MRAETATGRNDAFRAAGFSPRGRLVTRVSALWLAVIIVTSLGTLPLSLRWYNVQELDTAVRHAPSLHPVVAYEQYDGSPRGLKPAARIAHLAL